MIKNNCCIPTKKREIISTFFIQKSSILCCAANCDRILASTLRSHAQFRELDKNNLCRDYYHNNGAGSQEDNVGITNVFALWDEKFSC